jgi:hypothetical protein
MLYNFRSVPPTSRRFKEPADGSRLIFMRNNRLMGYLVDMKRSSNPKLDAMHRCGNTQCWTQKV